MYVELKFHHSGQAARIPRGRWTARTDTTALDGDTHRDCQCECFKLGRIIRSSVSGRQKLGGLKMANGTADAYLAQGGLRFQKGRPAKTIWTAADEGDGFGANEGFLRQRCGHL